MINPKMVIKIEQTGKGLYRLCFFLYVMLSYLFNDSISFVPTLLGNEADVYLYIGLMVIAMLLIIKIFKKLTIEDIKKIVPILILAVVSWISSNTIFLFMMILFLLSGKDVNVDEIIKTDLLVKCLCFIMVLFFHFNGIIVDYVQYKDGLAISTLGFKNINILAAVIFEINMMVLYLCRKNIKKVHIVTYMILTLFNFFLTRSRTPFYTSIIIIFFIVSYVTLKNKIRNMMAVLGRTIIFLVIIGTTFLLLLLLFNLEFFEINGEWLSFRFHLVYSFMKQHGMTLWGQKIITIPGRTLDVAYIYILIAYGIIGFLFFIFLHVLAIKNAIKDKEMISILIIWGFMLYGLGETILFRIEFNFSLFLLLSVIWPHKTMVEDNQNKKIQKRNQGVWQS